PGRVSYFFQAEDGIRDRNVTGVQTCALPIFKHITISSPSSVNICFHYVTIILHNIYGGVCMKRLGLFMLMILMTIVLAACSTENDSVELDNGYVYKEKSKFKECDSYNFVAKDYDVELHYPHIGVKRIDEKNENDRDREYE